MAGNEKNPEIPMGGVKSFSCPNCGGQVQVRAPGQTLSAACGHCGTVIDTKDDNFQIISRYNASMKFKPRIPFGTRGKMDGINWECIGFMLRQEPKWQYRWEEYLLFNPWHGFAWLTLSDGHWTFVRSIMDLPDADKLTAHYEGNAYRKFDQYSGKAIYVLGEFYWRVKAGEESQLRDYISPPYILTKEGNKNENIWSKGVYVDRAEVSKAFNVKGLPASQGVAPNQPNPYSKPWKQMKPIFFACMVLLVVAQILFGSMAPGKILVDQTYQSEFGRNPIVVKDILIEGRSGNVEVSLSSSVNNDWFGIEGTLVNEGSGEKFGFYVGAEYYHGVSGGESWSEGSTSGSEVMNNIPPGKYSLTMLPHKNNEALAYTFKLKLEQGVGIFSNFLLTLILVSILPIFMIFRKKQFETQRYANQ